VIAPEIGQVTDAVDSSPTLPDRGVHSATSAENEYEGDVAETVDVGETTTVVSVPTSDYVPLIVASTFAEAKS